MTKYRCPFCKLNFIQQDAVYNHMEKEHLEELNGLPAQQIYFNWKNRYELTKNSGKCVMTGRPTKFNVLTNRYERFADKKAREMYREYFRKNMIQKFGKDTILDEPNQQKIMLANRSISGEYEWTSGEKTKYTGSYEKDFLEFLDVYVGWENPGDIMSPAPMTFPYQYNEKQHFHIPDFYITSLNLIINIKSSDNKHYRLRDIEVEKLQDAAIKASKFNYIKLYDKDFNKLMNVVEDLKNYRPENSPRIFLEEYQNI